MLAVFVMRGIILACILPPFEGWDEFQHVGYIDHCAHSNDPAIYQETRLDVDFIHAVAAFPLPKDALTEPIGAVGYHAYWAEQSRPPPVTAPTGFYQSQHPFLYYRMMSPIYQLCGGRGNLRAVVSVLRLVNLGFASLAILLILLWIRRNLSATAAWLAAGCIVFQPILLLNAARVANDALAFFLGTIVVVLCLSLEKSTRFRFTALPLAVVLPLAILSKATNLALLPLVALAYGMRMTNGHRPRLPAIAAFLATTVVFALVTGPYFVFNFQHFGVLTPMQEAVANQHFHRGLLMILTKPPLRLWPVWTWCLWVRSALWVGGWSFLQLPRWVVGSHEILMAIALVLLGIQLVRHRIKLPGNALALIVALLVLFEAGLMYHAIESYSAWPGQVTTNPWYAAVAMPWLLVLIGASLGSLHIPRVALWIGMCIPLIDIIAEACGEWLGMIPFYYGQPNGLQRISSLHPHWLGAATLVIGMLMYCALLLAIGCSARACLNKQSRGVSPRRRALYRADTARL